MGETTPTVTSNNTEVSKRQKTGLKNGIVENHGAYEVWKYFTKQVIEGIKTYSSKADFLFCHVTIDSPSSLGTNKLWNHLKRCKEFHGFKGDKTQTLISANAGQASVWKFDQEKCQKSLTRMLKLCELPFSHDGFKWFLKDV